MDNQGISRDELIVLNKSMRQCGKSHMALGMWRHWLEQRARAQQLITVPSILGVFPYCRKLNALRHPS